jgi:hypothetical protein
MGRNRSAWCCLCLRIRPHGGTSEGFTGILQVDGCAGYLTDVITRIVSGHPNGDIDQLLPWAYRKQELKAVA